MRPGCTNSYASNYEASANADDGNCFLLGCTNPLAPNFNSWAEVDNGLCDVSSLGCTNSYAFNYNPGAQYDNGQCVVIGCTDSLALNFDPMATVSGVLCVAARIGCMKSIGQNYDESYNVESGNCVILGCMDSSQLGYSAEVTVQIASGLEGACIKPFPGCITIGATNFNSTANVDDGSCVLAPPPSAPGGAPPTDDFVKLDLVTTRSLAEMDALGQADLQASVPTFVASVPTSQPNLAGRRRLQSTPESLGLEDITSWVADADWRVEYARRLARVYWLPKEAVVFAYAETEGGGTSMVFNMYGAYLPAGTTPENLRAYATELPTEFYTNILAVPVTDVSGVLNSVAIATTPSPPPAPTSPPDVAVMSVAGMAPGIIVAIVLPIVVVLVLLGAGAYWYRTRRMKRVPLATVQPSQQVGGQLLVQPPDLPE